MTENEKVEFAKVLAAIRMQRRRAKMSRMGIPDAREIDRAIAFGVRKVMGADDMSPEKFEFIKRVSAAAVDELRRGNVDVRHPETTSAIRRRLGVQRNPAGPLTPTM